MAQHTPKVLLSTCVVFPTTPPMQLSIISAYRGQLAPKRHLITIKKCQSIRKKTYSGLDPGFSAWDGFKCRKNPSAKFQGVNQCKRQNGRHDSQMFALSRGPHTKQKKMVRIAPHSPKVLLMKVGIHAVFMFGKGSSTLSVPVANAWLPMHTHIWSTLEGITLNISPLISYHLFSAYCSSTYRTESILVLIAGATLTRRYCQLG